MSGELFNGGGLGSSYPPPNPMFSGTGTSGGGHRKKESNINNNNNNGGGSGSGSGANNNNNKELHMFVWSSSASPVSEGNLRHAVNRAASTEFASIDPSKFVSSHHERGTSNKKLIFSFF